jgi:hypothetical protein
MIFGILATRSAYPMQATARICCNWCIRAKAIWCLRRMGIGMIGCIVIIACRRRKRRRGWRRWGCEEMDCWCGGCDEGHFVGYVIRDFGCNALRVYVVILSGMQLWFGKCSGYLHYRVMCRMSSIKLHLSSCLSINSPPLRRSFNRRSLLSQSRM